MRFHASPGRGASGVLGWLLVAACTGAGEDTGHASVRDSAGVSIVTSTGIDRPLDWTVEPVLRLGDAVGPPETTLHRLNPYSVAAAPDGRLVVLNRGNYSVVVFSAEGTPLTSFGRRGDGPGEMRNPVSLWVSPSGPIRVLDWATGILSYEPDGTLISRDTGARGALGLGQRVKETSESTVFTWNIGTRSGNAAVEQVRLVTGGDTLVLGEVRKQPTSTHRYPSCNNLRIQWPPIFEPEISWDAAGERLVVVPRLTYEIDLYEGDGRRTRSIRRPFGPVRVTRDDALAELGPNPGMGLNNALCEFDAEELVDQRGFYDRLRAVDRLTLSPDGHLWVGRTRVGDEPGPIDVFRPDGVYAGTLPAATPFPLLFLDEDRYAAIETDELDDEYVVVYRVAQGRG